MPGLLHISNWTRISMALTWLKDNNPIYHDIGNSVYAQSTRRISNYPSGSALFSERRMLQKACNPNHFFELFTVRFANPLYLGIVLGSHGQCRARSAPFYVHLDDDYKVSPRVPRPQDRRWLPKV